jgi:N-acyl-L-homoserine lactone synthetase
MIQLITASCYGDFARARCYAPTSLCVFKERLGWDVQINGDLEVDEFDSSVLHNSFKSLAM